MEGGISPDPWGVLGLRLSPMGSLEPWERRGGAPLPRRVCGFVGSLVVGNRHLANALVGGEALLRFPSVYLSAADCHPEGLSFIRAEYCLPARLVEPPRAGRVAMGACVERAVPRRLQDSACGSGKAAERC